MPVPLGPSRFRFPLLKTEATFSGSGIQAARHEEGVPCEPGAAMLQLIAAARDHLGDQVSDATYVTLSGHDCLGDVLLDGGKPAIRLDSDTADLLASSPDGPVLYALALAYLDCIAKGGTEVEAMGGLLAGVRASSEVPDLRIDGLDPNGLLRRFLRQGISAGPDDDRRLIAWLRARMTTEAPYDQAIAAAQMEAASDLASLRAAAYAAVRGTLEPSIDRANAERVAEDCLERGVQLVSGRFSRAFYVEALLLANAEVLPASALREPLYALCDAMKAGSALHSLAPEVARLEDLAARDSLSRAELARALAAVRRQLTPAESAALEAVDAEQPDSQARASARVSLRSAADRVREAALAVESTASALPGRSPAYVVFFQRLTQNGTLNTALLNDLRDPFFGENHEILELLLEGGHNTYVTAEPSPWLRRCDHWIEAAPAYASHIITSSNHGTYEVDAYVQRSVLEDLYRSYAEDWLPNIEHVSTLEHISLARALVAYWLELGEHIEAMVAAEGIPAEEATRLLLADMDADELIAGMAALIERTAGSHCETIAAIRQEHGLDRHDALARLLREPDTAGNLAADVLREAGASADGLGSALTAALEANGLSGRARELVPMATMRRRSLPCIHVLTTLGPGETEDHIARWIEESMALLALSRALGMEPAVMERVEADRAHLIELAETLIGTMDLQHELMTIARAEGLELTDPAQRERALEALLSSAPEVAREVGSMALAELGANCHEDAVTYVRDRLDLRRAARREREEAIREAGHWDSLSAPAYRFESTGPHKRYHLVYTPSRVDLGAHEVPSVRDVPKWIGGADLEAARAAAALYALHNIGGPVALPSPRLAEFMKVGENFFTRGAVFATSLAAGTNIDALGLGDFEACRDQWNQRGDRVVLPTGETYGGFCIPKEFSLLIAAVKALGQHRPERELRLVRWVNKKAVGLEEINRIGPFRKVALIRDLLAAARAERPEAVGEADAIGVMAAAYKEGVRVDGREVPINDVRFSAGARKLEIYAGTTEEGLLKDIDPEGRAVACDMLAGFASPADVRLVGTCTPADVFAYTPVSRLPDHAAEARQRLAAAGLPDPLILANSAVYGADLRRWSGIREMPSAERDDLLSAIGDKRHLVALEARGVIPTYAEAVQGVDFLDLGIPDPELLDLIDDLPQLVALMRLGREHSALVFADGTSGARRRAFSFRYASGKRKVQELFALAPTAQYGALGLGGATIRTWRDEMQSLRDRARDVALAVEAGTAEAIGAAWERLRGEVARLGLADEAVTEVEQARALGLEMRPYALRTHILGRVHRGLPVQSLDFGTWMILGGAFLLSGHVSREELAERRRLFDAVIGALPHVHGAPDRLPAERVDEAIADCFRPRHVAKLSTAAREADTGVAGSLKAAEEHQVRLERREVRRRTAVRAMSLNARHAAFKAEPPSKAPDIPSAHDDAIALLGDPREVITPVALGRFLAHACAVIAAAWPGDDPYGAARAVSRYLGEGEITIEGHRELSTALLNSAAQTGCRGETLESAAMALELLDIALCVEMTQGVEDGPSLTVAIARFFDATLNSHVFDCVPYHYHAERSTAFEHWSRKEKLDLAVRRHEWLYAYLRHLLMTRTELAGAATWLGGPGSPPIGAEGDSPWFHYVRLRDAAVLCHEGYDIPEVLDGVPPAALGCSERATVAIVYPHGNTTVPVALEQGPRLAREEAVNLWLCAWPTVTPGRRPELPDALCFLGRDDYHAALVGMGTPRAVAEERSRGIGPAGRLCLVRFAEPAPAHGVFVHFTHPQRPEIDALPVPVIQPLAWEAATHLKCRLPDMLHGSGTRTADQANWRRTDAQGLSPSEALNHSEALIGEMATTHDALIVKAEKESGGRYARLLTVRQDGTVLEDAVRELASLACVITQTDNAVIQEVLPSHVRRLYTREFLEDMVARFAHLGVPVHLDRAPQTPLYSYFRQVVVLGESGYEITHHITVVSTRSVANVGQGGLLYEYTDDIIAERYRADLREAMTEATLGSLEAQRRYLREHWRDVLDEYLSAYPEYAGRVRREPTEDVTGLASWDIPYEMGDYMPVFLVDGDDCLTRVFDYDTECLVPLFGPDGQPTSTPIFTADGVPVAREDANGAALPIAMYDEEGRRLARFDAKGRRIRALQCYKIEANPGAGLWRPHNDRLPPERKGEGVYRIFRALGQRAHIARQRLREGS